MRPVAFALALSLTAAACGSGTSGSSPRQGALDPAVADNLDAVFSDPGFLTKGSVEQLGDSGDLRVAWPLVDLLRFHEGSDTGRKVRTALARLTGVKPGGDEIGWVTYSNHLLTKDVPAPPGYLSWKRAVFVWWDDGWAPFFDRRGDLDWREVTWGGVGRDSIEVLASPPTTGPAGAGYLDDSETVFGVTVDDAARAYPLRHMEVHELVNDTLGGRAIAMPYCTLCGSARVYFTDTVPERGPLELRTSGLLQRSNKLMYDVETESMFHQFLGQALTGPLRAEGVQLDGPSVATTTWGEWRAAHPDTTVLTEDAGTGRTYTGDALAERDAGADPIFPVGEVDPRLPAKERVLGVVTPNGASVAFPVGAARARLEAGGTVRAFGVEVGQEGGGLVARAVDGPRLVGQEAFWFAWSQFRVDTRLWKPTG